jgi:type IV secretion system protein VirD4
MMLGEAMFSLHPGIGVVDALRGDKLLLAYQAMEFGMTDYSQIHAGPIQRHLLTVAPTRAGKGVSLIIPNLLTYRGGAIVIDPKGENCWATAAHRRNKLGQKTYVIDPWGEVERRFGAKLSPPVVEPVARYNPMALLDPASEHYSDDIAYLGDALIISQGHDPHWPDSARELVMGLIAFARETLGPDANLSHVRRLICSPVEKLQACVEEAQNLGTESIAARKLARFGADNDEIRSIISTAVTQTAFLDSVTLQRNMAESDFSFEELASGKATIYLVLPVDKLQSYGRWLRLLISIAIRTVARAADPPELAVLFVLDEMGTIGKLRAVSQAYGLMAGAGLKLWGFVQDLNQLKRDYPEDWETFIANSSKVIAFGVMDQFSCEYFSKMGGTTTVWPNSITYAAPSFTTTTTPASRALIMPEFVRNLSDRECLIFGSHNPIVGRLLSYYADEPFASQARPDPRYKVNRTGQSAARMIPSLASVSILRPWSV